MLEELQEEIEALVQQKIDDNYIDSPELLAAFRKSKNHVAVGHLWVATDGESIAIKKSSMKSWEFYGGFSYHSGLKLVAGEYCFYGLDGGQDYLCRRVGGLLALKAAI